MFSISKEIILTTAAIALIISLGLIVYYWFAFTVKSSSSKTIDKSQEKRTAKLIGFASAVAGLSIGLIMVKDSYSKSFPWSILICTPLTILFFVGLFRNAVVKLRSRYGENH